MRAALTRIEGVRIVRHRAFLLGPAGSVYTLWSERSGHVQQYWMLIGQAMTALAAMTFLVGSSTPPACTATTPASCSERSPPALQARLLVPYEAVVLPGLPAAGAVSPLALAWVAVVALAAPDDPVELTAQAVALPAITIAYALLR